MSQVSLNYVGDCGPGFYFECKVAYWLWRIFPVTLIIIGTFGNSLNIVVLSRKQMRNFSTNIYVLFLAITELAVLWIYVVPETIFSITGYQIDYMSPVSCRIRMWLSLTVGAFSPWILVLLTLERTLLTRFPVFSRNKLTPRNAVIASALCFVIIALVNGHVIFGFRFIDIPAVNNSTVFHPQCSFSSLEYGNFFVNSWSVIFLIIHNLVPATFILIGNFNIAGVILLQRKRLARVNPAPSTSDADNIRKKSSTKILFIISGFFIITLTPWCIHYVARGQISEPLSGQKLAEWQLFTVIVNILAWSNFSFNFFFYFVSGSHFKSEWNRVVEEAKIKLTWARAPLTANPTETTRF